jgi:hypothetical protein
VQFKPVVEFDDGPFDAGLFVIDGDRFPGVEQL